MGEVCNEEAGDVQPRCTERQGDSATWFSDFPFFFYHGEVHITQFTVSAISECTVWQRPSYLGVQPPPHADPRTQEAGTSHPSPSPGDHRLLSVSMDLPLLDLSYKRSPAVYGLFWALQSPPS